MSIRSSSLLQKQLAFSSNIEMCREVIFGLRYSDITSYTGLPESTMISYDINRLNAVPANDTISSKFSMIPP